MRTLICGALFVIVTGILSGCHVMGQPESTDLPANVDTCILQSGGSGVLKLTAPANSKCTVKDGSLFIKSPDYELHVWLVDGAQSIDDGVARIDTQIASQFKDFKPGQPTDLTIAGAPAKRLTGPGHEADDGDNGDADVIVFKVGDHVFIACVDDEHLIPAARDGMLSVVQSAQKP